MTRFVRRLSAFALLLVVACGLGSGALPSEWVAADGGFAIYLSWTATATGDAADTLAGTIHEVHLVGGQVSASEAAFTGVRSEANVTLTIDQWLGSSLSITGTVTRDQLTLRLPNPDGSLSETILVPGSIDDHNANVSVLQNIAGQVAAQEAAAEQVAAQQRAQQEQAAATLRAKQGEFQDAASYLDQSYFDADWALQSIGYSLDTAGYLLDTLTSLVDDMEALIADGPVDDYLRESVGYSLDSINDTRADIDQTLNDAFATYGIGPILEMLPGDAEFVQVTATAFQQAGGDPNQAWPGWRDLVASVDLKVDEFTTRMNKFVDNDGAVRTDANILVKRAVSLAASVGVQA